MDQQYVQPIDCIKYSNYGPIPTSTSTYLSPISFVNINPFYPGYGYFHYGMNNFLTQLESNSFQ